MQDSQSKSKSPSQSETIDPKISSSYPVSRLQSEIKSSQVVQEAENETEGGL